MAAPFQNYSGGVLLADIVKRNNLSTYVSEAIKERSAFIKSGAVVRNALLDASEGGTRIQVPEFNPIAPTEEILDGTATWGTSNSGYLTPQKIGTGTQIATICHRGFAYAVDDVAVLAAGEDPMGHIRNQIADAINKLNSARLFSLLDGLFGSTFGPLGANALDLSKGAASGALTTGETLTGGTSGATAIVESLTSLGAATITGITRAQPPVVTCSGGHNFTEGQQVLIASVPGGNPQQLLTFALNSPRLHVLLLPVFLGILLGCFAIST